MPPHDESATGADTRPAGSSTRTPPARTFASVLDGATSGRRSSIDDALKFTRSGMLSISAMADGKANIMITVSSIVLSVTLTQLGEEALRWPLLLLTGTTVGALVFAILAVLPSKVTHDRRSGAAAARANPFFFANLHFLTSEEHVDAVLDVIDGDEQLYRTIVGDIHAHGSHLSQNKFRWLRYSYLCFMFGIALSLVGAFVVAYT